MKQVKYFCDICENEFIGNPKKGESFTYWGDDNTLTTIQLSIGRSDVIRADVCLGCLQKTGIDLPDNLYDSGLKRTYPDEIEIKNKLEDILELMGVAWKEDIPDEQ